MSKIPPLRCLFCNHRNLASARYCNDCGAELHLQPCNQCGAIDKRTATTCYKCGAQFNVPAAPQRAPVPSAPKRARAAPKRAPAPAAPELAAVPVAPVPESVSTPPILEHQIAQPTLSDGGFAIERAFPSKSTTQVVGTFRQGLRREVAETQGQAARVADRDPIHLNADPTHPAVEPQPMDETVGLESVRNSDLAHSTVEPQPIDETVESERAVTATGSRRARRLVLLISLLAATVASGYYYYDRSAQQLAQGQSAAQPAPSTPDGPISVGATAATVATQVDAPSAPKDTTSQPTTGAEEVEKAPSPAAPIVAKPRTDPEPVPANRPLDYSAAVSRPASMPPAAGAALSVRRSSVVDADVTSRKDPPIFKECTEAVAALGLCSPSK